VSSKSTPSKVKVKVPKVRRNSGEVRAYNEVPRKRSQQFDQWLLWGTVVSLFGVALTGGALLWIWGREDTLANTATVETQVLVAGQILQQARTQYVEGHMEEAGKQARLALGLELATPSSPPLELDIRRILSLVALQKKDYPGAYEQLLWLKAHQPSQDDRSNLTYCEAQLRRAQIDAALEQLRQAQVLLTQGQDHRALGEARQALRSLEDLHAGPSTLQAGHLIAANIALQQGQAQAAMLELEAADKLVPVGPQHIALLKKLQAMQATTKDVHASSVQPGLSSISQMQVRVTVPQLESAPSYPQGRPVSVTPKRPAPATPTVLDSSPGQAAGEQAQTPPAKPGPKLELPRLQLPGQGAVGSGSLPTYQSQTKGDSLPSYQDQSGKSLPTYSNKSRPRDSLPGY